MRLYIQNTWVYVYNKMTVLFLWSWPLNDTWLIVLKWYLIHNLFISHRMVGSFILKDTTLIKTQEEMFKFQAFKLITRHYSFIKSCPFGLSQSSINPFMYLPNVSCLPQLFEDPIVAIMHSSYIYSLGYLFEQPKAK